MQQQVMGQWQAVPLKTAASCTIEFCALQLPVVLTLSSRVRYPLCVTLNLLFRRRTAESKLADAEMQIEALESKVSSLSQLLDSEKAAAESALKASEQSWQTRLDKSVSAAATGAHTAAEEEANAVQSALQQQLDDANASRQVTCKPSHTLLAVFV